MNRILSSLLALILCCASTGNAQELTPFAISNWQSTDVQGQSWSLANALNADHVVLLFFFNAADPTSWDLYQSGILQQLNANYGVDSGGNIEWVMVESNPLNGVAQLLGPVLLSGNDSTQTMGDWISENPATLLDDAAWADSLALQATPLLLAVCPNYQAAVIPISDYETMADAILTHACPPLSIGLDAALHDMSMSRACGSADVSISWVLTNRGTEPLDSCVFEALNISGSPQYTWTGLLNSYESDTILWEGLTLLNDDWVYLIQAGSDVDATNDTVSARSDVGLSMHHLQLELNLDGFPEEVSWEIRNENDSVLFAGGNYSVPYQYINQTLNLPAVGCYRFTLNDEAGDGLHGSQWGGFDGFCYLRSLDDEDFAVTSVLYAYDGSYNFTEAWNTPASQSSSFEVGNVLKVPHTKEGSIISLFPNPANDEIHVLTSSAGSGKRDWRIVDLQGQVLQQGTLNLTPSSGWMNTSVTNLASGTYLFLIIDESGSGSSIMFSILR